MAEQPGLATKKPFKSFRELGRAYGETEEYDGRVLHKLAQPEKLSAFWRGIFRLMIWARLANIGWDRKLKKNNAFTRRFARPYSSD